MTEMIRILIADDHPIVRDGLTAVFSTQPDFEVVGEAGNGADAVRMVAELNPDVVLLDLEMPEMDGVEALSRMRESAPEIAAIVFTAFDTDERILSAIRAGARGYLLKGTPREELFDAVRTVYQGGSLIQPVVASKLMRQISRSSESENAGPGITPRESDVLHLLGQGLQNKEIAAELSITERTVKFHVGSILTKLNAGNRTEAVTIAVQRGLLSL